MPKAINIKLLGCIAKVGIRRVVDVLCKNDVRPMYSRGDAGERRLLEKRFGRC
jgi:hypothetical protein